MEPRLCKGLKVCAARTEDKRSNTENAAELCRKIRRPALRERFMGRHLVENFQLPQAANLRSAIAVRTGRTAGPAFHPYCALRRSSTKTIVLLTFFSFAS